jgi:hypothetical protein
LLLLFLIKTTLEKITRRIQSGGEWDVDLLPDRKKLEEFGIKFEE